MDYQFSLAEEADIPTIFTLYEKRIAWMDRKQIQQWNTCDYLNLYPISYYRAQLRQGNLYMLKKYCEVLGAVVLLDEDERWAKRKGEAAYYVHNLVTDLAVKNVGIHLISAIEALTKAHDKQFVRLDCAIHNAFLNTYYEKQGYQIIGVCEEQGYVGNKREKKIK